MAAVEHSSQITAEGGWHELPEPVALQLVDPASMPARPVVGGAVQLSRKIRLQLLDMEQEVARRDLQDALSERVIGEWGSDAAREWADDRTDEFAGTLRQIQTRRRLL